MRLYIVPLLLALFILWPASSAMADEPNAAEATVEQGASEQPQAFSPQHRQQIYEDSKLSTTRAVLYSAALPGIGNFYANQPAFGVISLMALSFSAAFIGFALANDNDDAGRIGVVIAATAWAGSTTTAAIGVRSHNRQLRRNLHLEANDHRAPTSASLDLTLRF